MDQWGTLVTGLSGFAFVAATIVTLVMRKWRLAGYLAVTAYVLLWPIHLWFWQFELTGRAPLPRWYFWSAVQQIVLGGIAPLIWFCFRRFRPVVTALLLVYVLSLVLQLFAYMYWAYGTTRDFSVPLSHLDAFYFTLGTLTTAGTGNISAISETGRGLQTLQMGLDLVLIGFVVALTLARYSNLLDRPHRGDTRYGRTRHSYPDERRLLGGTHPDDDAHGEDHGKPPTRVSGLFICTWSQDHRQRCLRGDAVAERDRLTCSS